MNKATLPLALSLCLPLFAAAQVTADLQIGLDAWDLHPSVDADTQANQSGNTRLFLANSNTAWPYQTVAPWVRFQGSARILADTQVTLKYRADQSLGSHVDEFSVDQSYHSVGIRIGVLDYKTSWCRTYDVDSPWVRENDPFCTSRSTSRSITAAPGYQLYANRVQGDYKWQAVVGAYNPLAMNYDTGEFTNTVINNLSRVIENNKVGASINVTHLENAFEMRLSILRTDQSADVRENLIRPNYRIQQRVEVLYGGVSFNPTPAMNVRLTQLQSTLNGTSFYPPGYARPDDTTAEVFYRDHSPKVSRVFELNYQANARDVYSVACSVYELRTDATDYFLSLPSMSQIEIQRPDQFFSRTNNTSLSWRRDWQKGIFTVLQWSYAEVQSSTNLDSRFAAQQAASNGHALGLRLGYRF